jgi:oligopeptidase B
MSMDVSATVAAPQTPKDPIARLMHGDTTIDEYAWLEDVADPRTVAFYEAQHAYAASVLDEQVPLREEILAEIHARNAVRDLTAPLRKGGWWYYTRTVPTGQYQIHCRRAVRSTDDGPPMSVDGGPLDGEEVLLDLNELAAGHDYFALGTFAVSPDGTRLAFSVDTSGKERFTMYVRDLDTGATLADGITDAFFGCAFSRDGQTLFYITVNEAWRPYRVWRHRVGTPADDDELVYEESDERFGVRVSPSRNESLVVITAISRSTGEVWLVDADAPASAAVVVSPRRDGVAYTVDHQAGPDGGRLLVLHNANGPNFELATAPMTAPAEWTTVVPHRDDTRLVSVYAFDTFVAVAYRRHGLTGIRVLRAAGAGDDIPFDEPIYTVRAIGNTDHRATTLRLSYTSFVTPESIYEYDIGSNTLRLIQRQEIRTPWGGVAFDPANYEQTREWAIAPDGTAIPMSIVVRRDIPRDGSAPFLLMGYGAYDISMDPGFVIPRLSLLDRGCGFAIAHVRGGGELGRGWYDAGRLARKPSSFDDFLASARHLVHNKWTSADRLVTRGGSAGGLLVGATVNLDPAAFAGVVTQVPFVDVLTAILDPDRPLTVGEWEEWGDPVHDPEAYRRIKSYSPYENVRRTTYPPILALPSANDTRVPACEGAKWVARLQERAAGGPFLLRTSTAGGHGGQSGRHDRWLDEAVVLAWVLTVACRFQS